MKAGAHAARALAAVGLLLFGAATAAGSQDSARRVLVTTVEGPITPVIANHLADGVVQAESGGYEAFVIRLDTPGGLDTSMRKIVQRVLAARLPVIVHVAPQGARAASAGAIITLSAHVAAMAPGTAIGASTPVELEGGDVDRKVVNDAAAFAESLARHRGRNVEFAAQTVREGRSVPADEAVEIDAVDLLAGSLPELLSKADGRTVELAPDGRPVTVRTAGAAVDEHDLGLLRRIQQRLADPNLAFLFLSIGTLGIIYELASPGVGAGGIVGVILILLGLFSLSVLPVNTVGLLFLGLAAGLFVAELFAPGVGVFAVGGAGALVLSGIFLFRDTSGMAVSPGVFVPVALVVAGAVVLAGRLVVRSQRAPSTASGAGLFVGRTVKVVRTDSRAQGFLEGAWWNLRSAGAALVQDTEVRVVDVDGLDLVVEPIVERDQRRDRRQAGGAAP